MFRKTQVLKSGMDLEYLKQFHQPRIVKVKLNVWHLHRSIIAMFVQYTVYLFSCGIVTVCALYQCKTPEWGRISKPKNTLVL